MSRKRKLAAALAALAALACLAGAVSCRPSDSATAPVVDVPGARSAFKSAPVVTRRGRAVLIRFEAAGPTDATVEVLGPDGRVVRHLASGVLGENAPAPFKKGSLEQVVAWLGDDDAGKPAPAGCRVRVALGLAAAFDRTIEWEPPSVLRRGILGMAADEKGDVYFLQGHTWVAQCRAPNLVAFSRDGEYLRTLIPGSVEVLRDMPGVKLTRSPLTGGLLPESEYPNLVPGLERVRRQVMLVRRGRLLIVPFKAFPRPGDEKARRRILSLGRDGRLVPQANREPLLWAGPALPGFTTRSPAIYLAADAAGEVLYVSGLKHDKKGLFHAVYRARWGDDEFKPFFGEPMKAGKDAAHLSDPRGLAVDAAGRLLICDLRNNRIQVVSPEGKLVKSLPVTGPEQVLVHPKTDAVYVLSVRGKKGRSTYGKGGFGWDDYLDKAIEKYAGVDDWRKVASIDLPKRKKHMHDPGPILALDASRKPARIWASCVGRGEATDYLWLVEDRGKELRRLATPIPRYRWPFGTSVGFMAVDRAREELYLAGRAVPAVMRVDGRTGRYLCLKSVTADVQRKPDGGVPNIPTDHLQVAGLAFGRDGFLYVRLMKAWSGMENWIRRYDRAGRRVAFTVAGGEIALTQPSHGYHPGGFAVAPDGSIHVINLVPGAKHRGKGEHNVLDVYGPDGKMREAKRMPFLTSSAWGPRFGPDGSMYLTEAVRSRGLQKPDELAGSLLKLRRAGPGEAAPRLRYGEKADPRKAKYELRYAEKKFVPTEIDGLEWAYYGVSPVPFGHCVCPAAVFDVDGHGRACVPDSRAHGVRLLDAAGNLVLAYGGYGNRDTRGLRGPTAVALSDEAAYIYDGPNRRVLRVRWTYAKEKVLRLP